MRFIQAGKLLALAGDGRLKTSRSEEFVGSFIPVTRSGDAIVYVNDRFVEGANRPSWRQLSTVY